MITNQIYQHCPACRAACPQVEDVSPFLVSDIINVLWPLLYDTGTRWECCLLDELETAVEGCVQASRGAGRLVVLCGGEVGWRGAQASQGGTCMLVSSAGVTWLQAALRLCVPSFVVRGSRGSGRRAAASHRLSPAPPQHVRRPPAPQVVHNSSELSTAGQSTNEPRDGSGPLPREAAVWWLALNQTCPYYDGGASQWLFIEARAATTANGSFFALVRLHHTVPQPVCVARQKHGALHGSAPGCVRWGPKKLKRSSALTLRVGAGGRAPAPPEMVQRLALGRCCQV